jgi:predicted kinase
MSSLAEPISCLADYLDAARRFRTALTPHVVELLRLSIPVVFDFAGNTPRDRAWVRSIFEQADADHVLHVIDVDDETCRARVHARNETKPDGVYFGIVNDEQLDEVNRFFVPPDAAEEFNVVVER